jgi:enolase
MSEFTIEAVYGREVLNGIGDPTVEADVILEGGVRGRASVPSGTSTGKHEALEIRDGGERYSGRGVLRAVDNVNREIAPLLVGRDASGQREIDEAMKALDGTENKSRLGANAMLAVSLAVADAASRAAGIPLYRYLAGMGEVRLPRPMSNVMAGGKHAGNRLDFEDHLVFPLEGISFREGVRGLVEIYRRLGKVLEERLGPVRVVGGAYAPPLESEDEALEMIRSAIRDAGYEGRFVVGLDVAASLFYSEEAGVYRLESGEMSTEELIEHYRSVVERHSIALIEDPLQEDDFEGFARLTSLLSIPVVGDDLFVTNRQRLERGIAAGAASAVLFKINQAGTLTDALETAEAARAAGYGIVASARSGESEDLAMADVAAAVGATLIKLGAPSRGERNSKYNRLMRIEEELQTGRRVS